MTWKVAFEILEIIVAVTLIIVILMQNRGAGLGGIFGSQTTVFRTRRGLERILYRATIGLAVVFVITSLASVRAHTATVLPLDARSIPIEIPTTPDGAAQPQPGQPAPSAEPSAPPSPAPEASPAPAPNP